MAEGRQKNREERGVGNFIGELKAPCNSENLKALVFHIKTDPMLPPVVHSNICTKIKITWHLGLA